MVSITPWNQYLLACLGLQLRDCWPLYWMGDKETFFIGSSNCRYTIEAKDVSRIGNQIEWEVKKADTAKGGYE